MPLYQTVSEILEAISEKEKVLDSLRDQMEEDFDLIFLEDSGFDPKGKDYHEYIDPAPQNFFGKVIDGANRAQLSIAIKLPEDASDDDVSSASDGELFVFGALEAIDRRLQDRQDPPLRQGLAWFGAARGWMAVRLIVHIPKGKPDVVFDCTYWDPMHIAWESASDGLVWVSHKRMLTKAQVYAEFGPSVAEGVGARGVEVVDFWDREGNSIIIGDTFLEGKANEPHGLDHVPVFITPVGSMPRVLSRTAARGEDNGATMKHRGQSVLHAWRQTIGPHNEEVSFIMDVAQLARDAPLTYMSQDGNKGLNDTPYGSFKVIRLASGEELKPIELPKVPPESAAIVDIIERGRLEATLPQPISHGGSEAPESGIALAIRIDQTRSVYTPRTEGLARVYSWLCRELIVQTKAKAGRKQMKLAGFDARDEFFRITTTPAKLDPTWFFDVRVEPRLPRDETEEANRFMLLTSTPENGEAGMSYRTGREEILKLRNPDAEHAQVTRERAERLPPVQFTRLAAALREQGDDDAAEAVIAFAIREGMIVPGPEEAGIEEGAGGQQPSPAGGTAGNAPPDQAIQQLAALLDQATAALASAGVDEGTIRQLMTPFVALLDNGTAPPPQAVAQLIDVLVQVGQQRLAEVLVQLFTQLGIIQPQSGAPAAAG